MDCKARGIVTLAVKPPPQPKADIYLYFWACHPSIHTESLHPFTNTAALCKAGRQCASVDL